MPNISQFYGITIRMTVNARLPPHFFAIYDRQELMVGISPIAILNGRIPQRAQSMVLEWAALHQERLIDNYSRLTRADPHRPIDPLV